MSVAVDRSNAMLVPRPVLCVTDHLGRDRGVADAARRGMFIHHGVSLTLGTRPDWRRDPHPDREWRLEWVKLYEGLDLGHAYAVTGDAGYLDTWQDLVISFVDQVPVGHDTSDVSARRLLNWLYAWQRFADSPHFAGLRPGLPDRLRRRMTADADHLAHHLTPERNHRTLELYALLLVGLALGTDHRRATVTLDLLADNAVADIRPDGVHREASTDYHHLVLRSFVGAIANARRFGLGVPERLVAQTQRAADFALHVQRPDGWTPAVSDGDRDDFRSLLALAAEVLSRDDLRWAATAGQAGTPPARRHVEFPAGGYHVQRSGWGNGARAYAEERFALFDCGPIGDGGHGHYDQLSVELYAAGRPLVVDPGRYTYDADHGDWRRTFKGTAAHNTVTVDGRDATPFRPGKPKGGTSTARFLGRVSTPGLDVLRGEVRSPCYDAGHCRTLALVADDYWVVHDQLRAPTPHDYQARWHLDVGGDPAETLAVAAGAGRVAVEPGWVSHRYGVRHPAPVLTITAGPQTDVDLVTVVLPAGARATRVSAAHAGHVTEIVVDRPGHRDRLCWRTDRLTAEWDRSPC